MTTQSSISIRNFRTGDEAALRALFHAAVHSLTAHHYNAEQRAAWAPAEHDAVQWAQRMQGNIQSVPYIIIFIFFPQIGGPQASGKQHPDQLFDDVA